MPAQKKYDAETQARAVRMYADRVAEGDASQLAARREVGELLGINQLTLRNWIRRDLGEGVTPSVAESDDAELVRLRQENARLRRANEILKTASAFFASAAGRPVCRPTELIVGVTTNRIPTRGRSIRRIEGPLDRRTATTGGASASTTGCPGGLTLPIPVIIELVEPDRALAVADIVHRCQPARPVVAIGQLRTRNRHRRSKTRTHRSGCFVHDLSQRI